MPLTLDQSWQSVLNQLQVEMPKASFDTWVRDTHVVSFDNGLLTVGTSNGYTRDWLESRLLSTVARMLVGIMNQSVEVAFVVDQPQEEETQNEVNDEESQQEDEADVQVVNRLRYEEVVTPSKVVAIPGYFSRLIPEIGARNAWWYVGWRQSVWNGERSEGDGVRSQRIPVRNIIRFSGLSRRTFFRAVEDESTWESLRGLVERQDNKPHWMQGRDRRSHRVSNKYAVHMTLPLSRADAMAIRDWLAEQIRSGVSLVEALKKAGNVKELVGELLPPAGIRISQPIHHLTVMDIAQELNRGSLTGDLQGAAEALHRKIIQGFGTILITHYFLEKVIPLAELTPSQAWLITLMRDRCYVNAQTGEVRDEVCVHGGYEEMADWIGLSRAKTIWEWVREKDGPMGGFLAVLPGREDDEFDTLRLKVRLEEPIFDSADDTHNMAGLAPKDGVDGTLKPGGVDTISLAQLAPMTGANGTSGWREWHRIKHLNTDSNNTPQSTDNTSSKAAAVFPTTWVLRKLLIQNHAHPKVTKELLSKNASAKLFVSWLLFAFSSSGIGIKDPFAYAIASLREEPGTGSGGVIDLLADLPPSELIRLIDRAPKSRFDLETTGGTGCMEWDSAMGLANPGLKMLRKILIGEDHL